MASVRAAVPHDAALRLADGGDVRGGGAAGDDDDDGGAGAAAGCPELQDLSGAGLFANRSFVVVRPGAAWWQQNGAAIADAAARIRPGSGLVVEAPKLDKRRRAVADLVKRVGADGALFEFRDLYETPYDRSRSPLEGELCRWVVDSARHLGVPMEPEAAWLVVGTVGKAPGELHAELLRLRQLFAGADVRAPLRPADLVGRLTVGFESTPFEFAEAVLDRDRGRAWRSLTAMFQRGVRQQDGKTMDAGGVLPFTASWLFGQFGAVYEGRLLLDAGVSPRDLPGRAGVRAFADRFVGHVQKNDLPSLQRGLSALHACQRASRLTGEEPQLLLERFLSQWFDGTPIATAEEFEL